MAHPRFLDIVAEIHRNGMMIYEVNTNGHYITEELLDEMRSIGSYPLMKISFDGVGFHDWMRQRDGAEARAIEAMRLCVEHGFKLLALVNMNWNNRSAIEATVELLEQIGVDGVRIIRTTKVPRWRNAYSSTAPGKARSSRRWTAGRTLRPKGAFTTPLLAPLKVTPWVTPH